MTPPREIICEIEHPNGNIVVRREPNGDHYSVLVGETNRHPNVNAEGVMRALATYLNSEIYSRSRQPKSPEGDRTPYYYCQNGKTIWGYVIPIPHSGLPIFHYHREDGPALVEEHGGLVRRQWYRNNVLHRPDGPAAIVGEHTRLWYFHGVKYSETKFTPVLKKWFGPKFERLRGDPEECLDKTERFLFRMEIMAAFENIRKKYR